MAHFFQLEFFLECHVCYGSKIIISNSCIGVLTLFYQHVFSPMIWDATLFINKCSYYMVLFLNFQLCFRSVYLFMPHCFNYRGFKVYWYLIGLSTLIDPLSPQVFLNMHVCLFSHVHFGTICLVSGKILVEIVFEYC